VSDGSGSIAPVRETSVVAGDDKTALSKGYGATEEEIMDALAYE
jgi:hypothetical protein